MKQLNKTKHKLSCVLEFNVKCCYRRQAFGAILYCIVFGAKGSFGGGGG